MLFEGGLTPLQETANSCTYRDCEAVIMGFGFHVLNRKSQLVSISLIWTSIRERNVLQMGRREATPNLSKPKNPVSMQMFLSWALLLRHWTISLLIFLKLLSCICQLANALCHYTKCCGSRKELKGPLFPTNLTIYRWNKSQKQKFLKNHFSCSVLWVHKVLMIWEGKKPFCYLCISVLELLWLEEI